MAGYPGFTSSGSSGISIPGVTGDILTSNGSGGVAASQATLDSGGNFTTTQTVFAAGNATFNGQTTTVGGNLSVTLNQTVTGNLTSTGNGTFNGQTDTFAGNVTVTGNTTFLGNITVAGANFTYNVPGANYTVLATDYYLEAGAANVTFYLPRAVAQGLVIGKTYVITNARYVNSSGGTATNTTISGNGSTNMIESGSIAQTATITLSNLTVKTVTVFYNSVFWLVWP